MKKIILPKFKISPGPIILLIILFYFIFLIRADWATMFELKAEKAKLQKEISEKTLEEKKITKEIALLDKLSYIELFAREKLGLIKRGEKAYKIVK